MANQSKLVELENQVEEAKKILGEIAETLTCEIGVEGTGKVYPKNRDHWGSVMVNLIDLGSQATELARRIHDARSQTPLRKEQVSG